MAGKRRALLSVSDKQGIVRFARGLLDLSFEVLSTGGTAKALRDAGLAVTDVSAVTGFPEIMDGRVKTLHPAVHGGLLARRGVDDAVLAEHGIGLIDVLAVNLYPFESTIARADCTYEQAIENIDVGGPAMIRAAAKNHERVTVVVDAADYDAVLEALRTGGPTPEQRRALAAKAFAHTAAYDAAITQYLHPAAAEDATWPEPLVLAWRRAEALRYGENPHQRAALYRDARPVRGTVAHATLVQGKPLSYNNLVDADTALRCAAAFDAPCCVIVKHANPCGVALADDARDAYERAYRCDPTSAFGGVIAFNRPLDEAAAAAILERQFVEVIAAPVVEPAARERLTAKPAVRVLETGPLDRAARALEARTLDGALLVQEQDVPPAGLELTPVTQRTPSDSERADLEFAWRVVRFVKSNAIVFARDRATLGIGAGQPSRVMSVRIAALKAEEASLPLDGAVMASDAFFPFRDGVDVAARYGIRAVVQPGGSLRDEEVIRAADEHGIAMVFTGMRHFRH
ncbi:MAG TPA: bifunctional phosphoribosylaminoimidazolecarboxamide formyltransferase/IMP cyclohydrolase [Gammaproteobacteria bacterium]